MPASKCWLTCSPRRPLSSGQWTSISGAIDYSAKLFADNGYKGFRRVIDISGDGYNNRGRPEWARDQAVAAGITINGLPILNARPNPLGGAPPADLDRYFEERVIGGPGAFLVVAEDFTAFARAIMNKLLIEIAGRDPGETWRGTTRTRCASLSCLQHREQHALHHAAGVVTEGAVASLGVRLEVAAGNVARRERGWRGHEQRREAA